MAITVLMRCLEDIERRAAHDMMFSEQVQGSIICIEHYIIAALLSISSKHLIKTVIAILSVDIFLEFTHYSTGECCLKFRNVSGHTEPGIYVKLPLK